MRWAIIGFSGLFVEEKRPDLLIKALDVLTRPILMPGFFFAARYDIAYEDTGNAIRISRQTPGSVFS